MRRTSGTKGRATQAELTNEGYSKLMATGPIHFREVHRLVFDVLTPGEVKALRRVTGRINAGLLGEINLGTLARGPELARPASRASHALVVAVDAWPVAQLRCCLIGAPASAVSD